MHESSRLIRVALVLATSENDPSWKVRFLLERDPLLGNRLRCPQRWLGRGEPSLLVAAQHLRDLTGIDARTGPESSGWLDLQQSGVWETVEELTLVYSALLPVQVTPRHTEQVWVGLEQLLQSSQDQLLAQRLIEVARRA